MDHPDLYDPKINRSYAELAAYYGTLVDPALRARRRTAAGGTADLIFVDSFRRGREFTSLGQMQCEATAWCQQVAGRWSCRPLPGAAPAAVFVAVEIDALPAQPLVVLAERSTRCGECVEVCPADAIAAVRL